MASPLIHKTTVLGAGCCYPRVIKKRIMDFFHSDHFNLIVLPIMIFMLRIVDVSLGTVRIIFVSKGVKRIAPFIGFFEVLIWIFVVSRIMTHLDNWICYVAYAGGFATGNYIGMILEEKLAIGHELVRVITKKEAKDLVAALNDKGFGITSIKAMGVSGEVAVIYIIINRSKIDEVLAIIKDFNPKALFTIEEIRSVNKEIFYGQIPPKRRWSLRSFIW